MKKTPTQRFLRTITKGFWILPKRRAEIQQEVLDHLDDIAEEQGITAWTQELLVQHFGSAKKLRKLFVRGGLPIWARFLKLGIWCLIFILLILLYIDLRVLWFFPISPGQIALLKSNDPTIQRMIQGEQIPSVQIQWLEPGDQVAQTAVDKLYQCSGILKNYYENREQQLKQFIEKRRLEMTAKGIIGATKVKIIQDYFNNNFDPIFSNMVEIKKFTAEMPELFNSIEVRWLMKTADPPYKDPEMPNSEFRKIYELWTSITLEDRIRFPRPQVTEEDIHLAKSVISPWVRWGFKSWPIPIPHPNQNFERNRFNCLQLVEMEYRIGKLKKSLSETIQKAKDFYAVDEFLTNFITLFQVLVQNIPGATLHSMSDVRIAKISALPEEDILRFIMASARWCDRFLEAIRPYPDPEIAGLLLVNCAEITASMIKNKMQVHADLPKYRPIMNGFNDLDFQKMLDTYPQWPDIETIAIPPYSWRLLAEELSRNSLFRAQCTVMQWFHKKDSYGYQRYEILKNYPQAHFMFFPKQNIDIIKISIKKILAFQAMSRAWLELDKAMLLNQSSMDFFSKRLGIPDPFSHEDLRYEIKKTSYVLRSAGPDGVYDSEIYDPSNGINSKGDIVWELRK